MTPTFPDLQGQAPLRHLQLDVWQSFSWDLFLTSKVRLHCDDLAFESDGNMTTTFPDLQGQAPLRLFLSGPLSSVSQTFPDLQGQAPLRPALLEEAVTVGSDFS